MPSTLPQGPTTLTFWPHVTAGPQLSAIIDASALSCLHHGESTTYAGEINLRHAVSYSIVARDYSCTTYVYCSLGSENMSIAI